MELIKSLFGYVDSVINSMVRADILNVGVVKEFGILAEDGNEFAMIIISTEESAKTYPLRIAMKFPVNSEQAEIVDNLSSGLNLFVHIAELNALKYAEEKSLMTNSLSQSLKKYEKFPALVKFVNDPSEKCFEQVYDARLETLSAILSNIKSFSDTHKLLQTELANWLADSFIANIGKPTAENI